VTARRGEGLETAERSDVAVGARGVGGRVGKSAPAGPGTLLWAEASDPGWHARVGGRDATHTAAFDWTNAFALPARASTDVHFDAGALPGVLVDLEVVAWLVAIVLWRRTRTRPSRRTPTVQS
jgi:hypothetical protein